MDEVIEAIEKYQGLVPLVYDIETMGLDEARPQDMPYAVYLKREADKVIEEQESEIAELVEKHKTEVKELLCLIRDKENNFNRAFDSVEKELRHQKYKRCLTKAEWCEERCARFDLLQEHSGFSWRREIDFYFRWYQRWLELADKFNDKEAK